MRLEDVSELEARELKDKLSRLSQDNRNFELKFKSQKEQSELITFVIMLQVHAL